MFKTKLVAAISSVLALLSFMVVATAFAAFTDVAQDSTYSDAVNYVQESGIVDGYSDGTYRPYDLINRAELMKILVVAREGATVSDSWSTKCFTDIQADAWYAKYVCAAKGLGYVDGYPDGSYKPSNNVNFAEAAKMIVIARGGQLVSSGENPWYYPYVVFLEEHGAIPTSISGFGANLTRGEMAEIIYRLEADVEDKPSKTYTLVSESEINATLQITSPADEAVLYEQPFYITGNTSDNCWEIEVTADNATYGLHDFYTLQNYELGDKTFKYGVSHEWNNLEVGENGYYITAYCTGVIKQEHLTIYYEDESAVEMGKPVIYLYPERETEVYVMPKPENGVTISEPALGDGWRVMALPNGSLENLEDGSRWEYLFWEGFSNLETPEAGFVVAKKDLGGFFDAKLSYLGLNAKEIADFKEFWLRQLSDEGYYVISFVDQSELDEHAPLIVEPAPDTSIRVFFDYKVSDKPVRVKKQVLEKGPERDGFTLVEWGGALY